MGAAPRSGSPARAGASLRASAACAPSTPKPPPSSSSSGSGSSSLEITDQISVDRAAAEILAAGPVDVLVNNAGAAYFGVVEAFAPEAIQRQFDVNVFGQMRVSRAFLPGMRERRSGLVLYVTSVVGRYTFPFGGVYASSKWALEALAESSSYELAPLGVDVAIVQPAAYETNIGNSGVSADDQEAAHSTYLFCSR